MRIHALSLGSRQFKRFGNVLNHLDSKCLESFKLALREPGQLRDMPRRYRLMTLVEKFAGDGIGALPADFHCWRFILLEHATLRREPVHDLAGDRVDLLCEVLNDKQLVEVVALAVIDVVTVQVHEARRGDLQARSARHMPLDGNVTAVVVLHLGGRLDLHQSPAASRLTLQRTYPLAPRRRRTPSAASYIAGTRRGSP